MDLRRICEEMADVTWDGTVTILSAVMPIVTLSGTPISTRSVINMKLAASLMPPATLFE